MSPTPRNQHDRELTQELEELDLEGLRRAVFPLAATGGQAVRADTNEVLYNFSSNDYLGLANHPRVRAGAAAAVEQYGVGSTASRLMSGSLDLHDRLEQALAVWADTGAALVFGSGFLANVGVMTALAGAGDAVFSDRMNHASLIDGMRLSGATWRRYRHSDASQLRDMLVEAPCEGRRIVVTDSVFSMDGDIAPLEDIATVAREFDAWLVVDEAHAFGVFGPAGGGLCRELPDELRPDAVLGTMSKSLGSYGGFVACSATMREFLINKARTFIYSTGLPPACAGGALAALEVIVSDGQMGRRLLSRARALHQQLAAVGVPVMPFSSQILPVMVGENQPALDLANAMHRRGFLTTAVRPPTVPRGTSRLRLSLSLAHSTQDIERLANALADEVVRLGIR